MVGVGFLSPSSPFQRPIDRVTATYELATRQGIDRATATYELATRQGDPTPETDAVRRLEHKALARLANLGELESLRVAA